MTANPVPTGDAGNARPSASPGTPPPSVPKRTSGAIWEVFVAFLRLGFTSFGGPVAHLGFFREAFVTRRSWLTDRSYADLVALCQFLPGPASSQVGMAIGLHRAGAFGMLAAWAAFTLPSAALMVLFAYGVAWLGASAESGWVVGLKAAAVAVVAHAVFGMAKSLTPDARRATIAVAALVVVLLVPGSLTQVVVIALAAIAGLLVVRPDRTPADGADELRARVPVAVSIACLVLFGVLLAGLPALAAMTGDETVRLVDVFYRAGALVFGGGHVVLPLLEAEVVQTGLVSHDIFLAGYGAAQAVPGPLFTFAAFLGASTESGPTGVLGGTIALLAIFLPAVLLIIGVLPFWERVRRAPRAQRALGGVNAGVVGILAAALYTPVFTEGITDAWTLSLAAVAFVALTAWRAPSWAVVIGAAIIGGFLL
ncbi:chromate transporter [Pseudoclavibacter endophyticus]|uniref:Chromate efflux transporter n=1 Tax=Pseudoclavibacter endophyticus TaxID=1778590 RepID=A0A6H9WRA9_9MICO|nr:chromate efflux transporter [Pseudoclavibacter endophyticus]KAB1649487.1 chromate efflux transporter [Pseudoclavibacter endophyticus]GGA62249.1 chromate transporter [Pseudoclavibacter endophyticus]